MIPTWYIIRLKLILKCTQYTLIWYFYIIISYEYNKLIFYNINNNKQTGLEHNGSTKLAEIYKLKWSKPRLFAIIVHSKIFTRIATGCCSQQDFSLWQLHRCQVIPTSCAFNECARKDRNLLVLFVECISLQTCIRASLEYKRS